MQNKAQYVRLQKTSSLLDTDANNQVHISKNVGKYDFSSYITTNYIIMSFLVVKLVKNDSTLLLFLDTYHKGQRVANASY